MATARKPVPWVRYEPGAWLLELMQAGPRAELAHRRLADYHWVSGEWPVAGGENTAGLCRVATAEWPELLGELRSLGWSVRGERLYHPGVHRVRANAAAALNVARKAGRLGAQQRWGNRPARAGQPSPGGSRSAARSASGPYLAMSPALRARL